MWYLITNLCSMSYCNKDVTPLLTHRYSELTMVASVAVLAVPLWRYVSPSAFSAWPPILPPRKSRLLSRAFWNRKSPTKGNKLADTSCAELVRAVVDGFLIDNKQKSVTSLTMTSHNCCLFGHGTFPAVNVWRLNCQQRLRYVHHFGVF